MRALQRQVEALGAQQDATHRSVVAIAARQESVHREVVRIGECVDRAKVTEERALARLYEAVSVSQGAVTRRLDSIQAMLSEIMTKVPA